MSERHTNPEPPFVKLEIGKRYGRWTVLEHLGMRGHFRYMLAQCECGVQKQVTLNGLRSGSTRSCGCLSADMTGDRCRTHGMTGTTEYRIWRGIKDRCLNPNKKEYPNYGGRGITVCDRWNNSFEDFLADMGMRPSKQHSIERRNNDGPYAKDNCYWATKHEQVRNSRHNVFVEYKGERKCLHDWAIPLGMRGNVLKWRIEHWGIERAMTTPINHRHRKAGAAA